MNKASAQVELKELPSKSETKNDDKVLEKPRKKEHKEVKFDVSTDLAEFKKENKKLKIKEEIFLNQGNQEDQPIDKFIGDEDEAMEEFEK